MIFDSTPASQGASRVTFDLPNDVAQGLTPYEVVLAVRHMRSLPQGKQPQAGPLEELNGRIVELEKGYQWLRDNLDALREGLGKRDNCIRRFRVSARYEKDETNREYLTVAIPARFVAGILAEGQWVGDYIHYTFYGEMEAE